MKSWLTAALVALVAGLASSPLGASPGGYDAVIDPSDFVRRIDNRYLPLKPGTTFLYEGKAEDGGAERVRVTVTRQTKRIFGVTCVVVLDTSTVNGKPRERTFDWYAQDQRGNVWYMGEDSRDFKDGRWVHSDGSWQAGVDGARPGIVMPAHPRPGRAYRQEYYAGHAEDMAKALGTAKSVSVAYGTFRTVLMTLEWSPLEPGVAERKYYAPGIGEIKVVVVKGGSGGAELVQVGHS